MQLPKQRLAWMASVRSYTDAIIPEKRNAIEAPPVPGEVAVQHSAAPSTSQF